MRNGFHSTDQSADSAIAAGELIAALGVTDVDLQARNVVAVVRVSEAQLA